jgi:hypothetical protein
MVIGANDDLRAAVVYWSIYSFKRQPDYRLYIFADKNDELYTQYNDKFKSFADRNIVISTSLDEICGVINDIHSDLKPGHVRTLIVWLGLENIAGEFPFLPEKGKAREAEPAPGAGFSLAEGLEADLDAMLNAAFGNTSIDKIVQQEGLPGGEAQDAGGSAKETPAGQDGKQPGPGKFSAYNAGMDIQEIIAKGSRYGIFTLVSYSSHKSLKDTRFVKAENFEHKIAFNMSMDESSAYLGRSSHASGLDNITAVYYDGTNVKMFRPYLM